MQKHREREREQQMSQTRPEHQRARQFDKLRCLTCLPSALHRPLLVLVGAMVTTGGVPGTPWPLVWPRRGPKEPRLGVETGELWLVAGEETGDDSPLRAEPEARGGRDGVNDRRERQE